MMFLYKVDIENTNKNFLHELEQKITLNHELREIPKEAREKIVDAITKCTLEIQKIVKES